MLVEAKGVSKIYTTARGNIAALDGVDLHIQAGEFIAVCGRSGSGKSTLLGVLGGLCRPSAGVIRIDGTDLGSLSHRALAEFRARRFGFLFQFAGLLPNLRVTDNIALPALLAGVGYQEAYTRARDLLARVELADRWDAYPGELSGGQERRVALARALVNRPALVLADEPTNDLDEVAEAEVSSLLRDLPRVHGITLIVVTHDARLARQAHRVVFLKSGRLLVDGASLPADAGQIELPAATQPVRASPERPEPGLPAPVDPVPLGAGLGRFLVGFAGWVLLVVFGLLGFDYLAAQLQRKELVEKQEERKRSQELALQQLRADIEDVSYLPDGGYQLSLYLNNADPDKPFHVLGPSVRVFVQVDQNWQDVSAKAVGFEELTVREVAAKQVFPFVFRADLPRYEELIKGYMHVRITNTMLVSERPEPAEDIFQRTDDYYIYLKPRNITEEDVRKRNGWKAGALVPRWIAMPSH